MSIKLQDLRTNAIHCEKESLFKKKLKNIEFDKIFQTKITILIFSIEKKSIF